ncbi:MAG: IS110 family transposase, partial [Deltaproteobacteria bacterium]|nr:IS110 family transposase [Deltaproteobacteria bacterium]
MARVLARISGGGADLTRIPGIKARTALTIISEVGLDMSPWPSSKHFCSYHGLCPGSNVSGRQEPRGGDQEGGEQKR